MQKRKQIQQHLLRFLVSLYQSGFFLLFGFIILSYIFHLIFTLFYLYFSSFLLLCRCFCIYCSFHFSIFMGFLSARMSMSLFLMPFLGTFSFLCLPCFTLFYCYPLKYKKVGSLILPVLETGTSFVQSQPGP